MTITDFELSFQFPIKRDGASPVAAAAAVVVPSGVGDAESDAIAEGLADAVAAGASSLFFPFAITIAPSATTPISTARSTFEDDPWRGAADGFAGTVVAAAGFVTGVGVVVTLTRALPVAGTGGTTTFDAADFFTDVFLVAFLVVVFFAAAFLVAAFLTTAFFATFFFATDFLAVVFLATDFFAAVFFAGDFLAVAFLAVLFFFTATSFSLD